MSRPTFIYFVAPIGGGPIKIGCSENTLNRLSNLMSWSPMPLELLASAPGTVEDERAIHGAFVNCWSHREWFRATPEIYALINTIRATREIPAEFRGRPKQPMALPRKPRPKWSAKSRAGLSKALKQAWATKRELEALRLQIMAFLSHTGMPDAEFDKGVGLVGAANTARTGGKFSWPFSSKRAREFLAAHQTPPAKEAAA